jgi:hypothetical protein
MMAPSLSRYLVTSATFSLNSTGLASFNARSCLPMLVSFLPSTSFCQPAPPQFAA